MWRAIAAALALLVLCEAASAEGIQAQCGNEGGRAYAAAQGIVSEENAGWYDDTTTGETVIRIDTGTGEVDVRFKDATRVWQSVTDQGGQASLFAMASEPLGFVVVVAYPGTTLEVLTIAEVDGTEATLIHTVARSTPRITNSRVMVASCTLTAF